MEHSFSKEPPKSREVPEILERGSASWCFEVPKYKLFRLPHYFAIAILFLAVCILYFYIDYDFFYQSFWALFFLPATGLLIGMLIIYLLPNKQIYYVINQEGIYEEVHITSPYPISLIKLLASIVGSWFIETEGFTSSHQTLVQTMQWEDVRKIEPNQPWGLITVKGALKGTIRVWTTEDNFQNVYSLIAGYSAASARRKNSK